MAIKKPAPATFRLMRNLRDLRINHPIQYRTHRAIISARKDGFRDLSQVLYQVGAFFPPRANPKSSPTGFPKRGSILKNLMGKRFCQWLEDNTIKPYRKRGWIWIKAMDKETEAKCNSKAHISGNTLMGTIRLLQFFGQLLTETPDCLSKIIFKIPAFKRHVGRVDPITIYAYNPQFLKELLDKVQEFAKKSGITGRPILYSLDESKNDVAQISPANEQQSRERTIGITSLFLEEALKKALRKNGQLGVVEILNKQIKSPKGYRPSEIG